MATKRITFSKTRTHKARTSTRKTMKSMPRGKKAATSRARRTTTNRWSKRFFTKAWMKPGFRPGFRWNAIKGMWVKNTTARRAATKRRTTKARRTMTTTAKARNTTKARSWKNGKKTFTFAWTGFNTGRKTAFRRKVA